MKYSQQTTKQTDPTTTTINNNRCHFSINISSLNDNYNGMKNVQSKTIKILQQQQDIQALRTRN